MKSSWFLTDPSLVMKSGVKIPQITADTTVSYLGRRISPWAGLTTKGLEGDFMAMLQRVGVIGLEPHQRGQLISMCLISHFSLFLGGGDYPSHHDL
jgi:hypothetical protein